MAKFTDKISNLIKSQAPEFVLSDHPKFVEFVQKYYTFMESAELAVTSVENTDGLRLESEIVTNEDTLLLDASRLDTDRTQLDAGDKVLLEDTTYGKFTRGETITGQSSGATSVILSEDLDNGKLYIQSQDKFEDGEAIVGATSNARALINNYRPNPVNNIQELLTYRDPDKVISNFLTKFRNEFLNTIPENLGTNVDKRKLIKNVKSVYRAKGTTRGHEMFFRLLFGIGSETFYPRENMLRISDGKWTTNKILRAISTVGEPNDLIGRTITGQTSEASAIVEAVSKFQIGADEIVEFTLNDDSISGTFVTDEELRGTATDDAATFIKSTVTGIPDVISITNDGSLNNVNDTVSITGAGSGAVLQVDAIGNGAITEFVIDDGGSGYEIGDDLVFNNTNTNGGAATAKVSVVNGGFTQETSSSLTDDHIVLEDETVRGDPYTGNKVVQESGTGSNDITDIRIINGGGNYTKLPLITITSSSGNGASVFAYGDEIGKVQQIKIVESGKGYQDSPSPTLALSSYVLLKDVSGSIVATSTATSLDSSSTTITATVSSYDNTLQILKVTGATGNFEEGRTITFSNGASAVVGKSDAATATVTVGTVVDTAGTFVNQDGHISEDAMRIQDSLYYQDFSYVIKVGRTIADWRDSFKKTMHTAGFYFTGQVNIENRISAQINSPVEGIISGITDEPLFGVTSTLFSTIFGRRLGTLDDGTSQRSNAHLGVDPDFDDSTASPFSALTRDVTLRRSLNLAFITGRNLYEITFRGAVTPYLRGYAYGGPRMSRIGFNDSPFGTRNLYSGSHSDTQTGSVAASLAGSNKYIAPMRFVNWADFRLSGFVNTTLDGTEYQIRDFSVDNLKVNLAIPTQLTTSVAGFTFDQTDFTFDETGKTFDETA